MTSVSLSDVSVGVSMSLARGNCSATSNNMKLVTGR